VKRDWRDGDKKSEDSRHRAWEKTAGSEQQAAVLSPHRALRHVASPSLGQDASLSFVVIGRGQEAFSRKLGNLKISQYEECFAAYRLLLTVYRLLRSAS
jgi:hypothetical protein